MSQQTQFLIAVLGFPAVYFITGLAILWLNKRDLDRRLPYHPSLPSSLPEREQA